VTCTSKFLKILQHKQLKQAIKLNSCLTALYEVWPENRIGLFLQPQRSTWAPKYDKNLSSFKEILKVRRMDRILDSYIHYLLYSINNKQNKEKREKNY